MDELMQILENLRPDVDFENETALITNGVLDSFDIVALVGELNDEFDIEIKPNNLIPENFNSAKAMWAMISKSAPPWYTAISATKRDFASLSRRIRFCWADCPTSLTRSRCAAPAS